MARPQPTTQTAEFEALVQEGQKSVLRYLMARADSLSEANELAQETFVRAYCALAEGTEVVHPIPWLLAIARNVFLETLRSRRYERQLRERMARMMGREWESPWHGQTEQRLIVANALEGLSPELREPVTLHYFGGLSVAEIAGHLEISVGAVKTRLWRARQSLRGELEVLVSDAERKSPVLAVPRDLAAKAKMIAERPPSYESVSVGFQVGGPRWATSPMFEPLFPEQGLSLDDVRLAVERLHAAFVAGDRPLAGKVELGPGPEIFYHAQPVEVWEFLRSAESGNEEYQNTEEGGLVITDGWRLGTDAGAPELLDRCREAGIRHVWFTFAGLRETHDDLCQRPGAFDAIVEAMKRCREAGIATGANNIVTTRNAREAAEVALLVRSLGGERFVPTYPFVSDRRDTDYLQPEPDDLTGLPPQGLDVDWGKRDFWADPSAFTEAALVKRTIESASQSTDVASAIVPGRLDLWVSPDLSLRIQEYPAPRFLVAHLRNDRPEAVYDKLAGLVSPKPPSEAELARRYGDPTSRKVFFGSWDYRNGLGTVRLKWLDAWRKENNIPWLPWPWG